MSVTTWWGLITAAGLIGASGWIFHYAAVKGRARTIEAFRRWTVWTAVGAAVLVMLAAVPFAALFPLDDGLKDAATSANAIGPLVLTISATLASIFYSAGEWYEMAQRFRLLGIIDAKPDRQGRQSVRAREWQDTLRSTEKRAVISGVTLGGWFVNGWQETRESLLMILPRAKVQVLLAHPAGDGFKLRALDPAEAAEAKSEDEAQARARRVYERLRQQIFNNPEFAEYLNSGQKWTPILGPGA